MLKTFFFLPLFIYLSHFDFAGVEQSRCQQTDGGPAIEWSPELKLVWTDFKSAHKVSRGFSIAASTCGFGYDGLVSGNKIEVNIYVRFYCEESWRNPDFDMEDVLEHEQLHFDICELYGRKFYKGVTELRKRNNLSERNLQSLYDSLVEEYDRFQDEYDDETNHSTVVSAQKRWNSDISKELDKLSGFANYTEF